MGGRAVGPATRAPGRARGVSGGHAHRVSSGEASSLPPLRPPLPPLPLSRSLRFLQSPRPPPRPPARQSAATVRRLRRPPPPPPRAGPLHCGGATLAVSHEVERVEAPANSDFANLAIVFRAKIWSLFARIARHVLRGVPVQGLFANEGHALRQYQTW